MERVAGGAVHVAGGPVVAEDSDVGCGAAYADTGSGQEDCTGGFHGSPGSGIVNIDSVAGCGVDKGEASGADPVVRKNDVASGALDGGHALQLASVGALGEQVGPLAIGEGAPQCGLVAAIDNGVVESPVGVGVEIYEVVAIGGFGVFSVVRGGFVGHEASCAAVPAAGAVTEQIDPRGAVGLHVNIVVVAAGDVVLVDGETPGFDTGSVLQVALREVDFLGGTHAEDAGQRAFDSGVLQFKDPVGDAVDALLENIGNAVDAVVECGHLGGYQRIDVGFVGGIARISGCAEVLNLAVGVVVDGDYVAQALGLGGNEAQVVVELAEVGGVINHAVPFDCGGAGGRQDDVGVVAEEEGVATDGELQVVDELAEMSGVVEHAVPFNCSGAVFGQYDKGAIVEEEGVAADVELQVVDELAEIGGAVEHAVPLNGGGSAAAGGQNDIGAVVEEEGVAVDVGVEVGGGEEVEVVDKLAQVGGAVQHAVPLDGGGTAVVRQDDIGAVVEEEGVAVQGQLQVALGEEVEVVDELAEAGGRIAQAVVEEAPCAEAGVLFVIGEVFAYAVSHGGVEGVWYCQYFLGGGKGVVVATIGVDFAHNIVRTLSPVDVGKVGRIFTHDQREEAVGIGGYVVRLLIDGGAVGCALQNVDAHADAPVGHQLAGGIPDDGLVIESFRCLCIECTGKKNDC